jgi:hypothetical protein
MVKKGTEQTATVEAIKPTLSADEELTLLRGFKDLVAERTAYFFGAKELRSQMSDQSATERKAVTEANKSLRTNLKQYIKDGNLNAYESAVAEVERVRKILNTKTETMRGKIAPLNKAVRYIDVTAVPDSLKELGSPIAPSFKLSEWCQKAVETKKKQ